MRRLMIWLLAGLWLIGAQPATAQLADVLAENRALIERSSRQTIGAAIEALVATADPAVPGLLQAWADRGLGIRKSDGAFFFIREVPGAFALRDVVTGAEAGEVPRAEIEALRPNSGVRGLLAAALVEFRLVDPDPAQRRAALTAIARDGSAAQLEPLRAALADPDPAIAAQKQRLERLLTLRFDPDPAARVAAIEGFGADLGLDLRGALNPLVATRRVIAQAPPEGANIARELRAGDDIPPEDALALLVGAGHAPPPLDTAAQRDALAANIVNGLVGGVPVHQLSDQVQRDRAYQALEAAGLVPAATTQSEIDTLLQQWRIFEVYAEPDASVTDAATYALTAINVKVGVMQTADLGLDAISLASIYFLASDWRSRSGSCA